MARADAQQPLARDARPPRPRRRAPPVDIRAGCPEGEGERQKRDPRHVEAGAERRVGGHGVDNPRDSASDEREGVAPLRRRDCCGRGPEHESDEQKGAPQTSGSKLGALADRELMGRAVGVVPVLHAGSNTERVVEHQLPAVGYGIHSVPDRLSPCASSDMAATRRCENLPLDAASNR